MENPNWQRIDAQQSDIDGHLNAVPGVYQWRRKLGFPFEALVDQVVALEHIQHLASQPLLRAGSLALESKGVSGEVVIRQGIVRLMGEMTIGGGSLSEGQVRALVSQLTDRRWRESWGAFLRAAESSCPPLYVGETDNLVRRFREHRDGSTGLESRIQSMGMEIGDLFFEYCEIPNSTREDRCAIEAVLTHVLLAPLVKRPG